MGLLKKIKNFAIVVGVAWLTLKYFGWRDSFNPEEHVKGKRVLVTGASTGIGRATALLFCKWGAHVVITSRSASKLEKVIEECAAMETVPGTKRGYVTADMSDIEAAAGVVPKAVEILGGLDFLILNHCLIDEAMFGFYNHNGSGYEVFRKMFDINFFSYVKMTDVAMPYLKESSAKVAVINSVVGRAPDLLSTMYGSTKHAMDGFYQGLDLEHGFRGTGVSFTVMMIGPVDTFSEKANSSGPGSTDEMMEKMARQQEELNIDFMKLFIRYGLNMGKSEECAEAIIKATSLRKVEGWYRDDVFQWGPMLLKWFFPEITRNVVQYVKHH